MKSPQRLVVVVSAVLAVLLPVWAAGEKVPDEVKARLDALVPGAQPDNVRKSPVDSIYEVSYGAQVVYLSDDGRYMFTGSLYDLNTRRNLTDGSRSSARKVALDAVDESEMIVYGPKNPRHTVTVFTDIDCPYCRKLHDEIPEYKDLGISVRYLLFPRAGAGSPSYEKAVSVWCADDRNAAMDTAKGGGSVPPSSCSNPVAAQMQLGRELGVNGTPAIVLENGELLPGYRPAKELAVLLDQTAKADTGEAEASKTGR